MNEDLSNQIKYDNSTIDEIFNDILKRALQKLKSDITLDNIYRESSRLRLKGDTLKEFYSQKVKLLIYRKDSQYLLSIDELKNELYKKIFIDYHLLKESSIDELTIKTMLINDKEYSYFSNLYMFVHTITELDLRMDELDRQSEQLIEEKHEPEIPENIALRHSILLMYELGVVQQLETELKKRGINLAQQNRNYLPNLLSVLMNVNDKSTQDTIRKEISQHTKIKTPINQLNKILAGFGLQIENLKIE